MHTKNPVLFQTALEQMDEQVERGSVLEISASGWQQAMEDFRYKGLVQ
jgi:hypothetical protein